MHWIAFMTLHALNMFSIFERIFLVGEDCFKIFQFVWPQYYTFITFIISMSLTFFFKVVCLNNASEDEYKWQQGKNSSGQEGDI